MTVVVSFISPKALGSIHSQVIGACRVRENITVPGTTTATAQEGEIVVIGNAETSMVAMAFGSTPDAAATAQTSATIAGVPIPAGTTLVARPAGGDKINIKAVS